MNTETRRIEWLLTARNEAGRVFNEAQRDLSGLGTVFSRLRAAAAAVGGFALLAEAKRQAIEAEQAGIRLDAVLRATGYSAGLTRKELERMTEALSGGTNFSGGDIRAAQAALLKFGNIQGEVFERGIKLAADWAAFLGVSIPDAAQQIGRALQAPSESIGALEKQFGKIGFTQKENIKTLVEQGRLLEAQAQILSLVEGRVGGTAARMREGLGGATAAVRKEFNDLLETLGKGGSRGNQALEGLASLLRDIKLTIEGTRNPLQELLLDLANFLDKLPLPSGLAGGLLGNAPDAIRGALGAGRGVSGRITNPLQDQGVARLGATLAEEQARVDARAEKAAEARKVAAREAESLARRQESARDSLLEGYDREINKLNDLTELEKLRFDIGRGRYGTVTQAFRDQAEAQARLVDLIREEKKLRDEIDRALKDDVGARAKLTSDAEQINRDLENVRITLLEQQGRVGEAAGRRFDQQNRNLTQALGFTPEVKDLRDSTVAAAEFNRERARAETITARLALEEERIQNAQRVGAIGQFTALTRTSEARRAAADELERTVVNLERLAASRPLDETLAVQAERARVELERLRGETNLLADTFNEVFADNASSAFADFINGTRSAGDAFRSFADGVLRDINRIVSQEIASNLFGSVRGGGGAGGLLAGLFGSGSTQQVYGPTKSGGNLDTGGFFGWLSGLFRADGGPVSAGNPYIVGERGPELFVPRQSGTVVPNGQFSSAAPSMTYAPTFVIPATVDRRSIAQIEAAAFAGAQRSAFRYG